MREALDPVIDRALGEQRIVGAVVRVAVDGDLVYRRAAGFADREAQTAMRDDAVFRLSSITKPVVSAAALSLVEQGRLQLDDEVTRWLPAFRPRLADGTRPPITIHQLLSHTAGLGYGFLETAQGPHHQAGVSDGLDQPGLSLAENLRRLATVPLHHAPGSAWRYSLATDVLGGVIEQVTGRTLPEVVAQRVTAPLAMHDTGFEVADPARLATPYVDARPQPLRMRDPQLIPFGAWAGIRFAPGRVFDRGSYASGGSGLLGTADDVLAFLEALRGDGGILRAQTLQAMRANQTGTLPISLQGAGWGFGYGFAVVTDPLAARTPQSAGSCQWGGVYGHSWFVDPARRLSVVTLTNTAIEGMAGALPTRIRNAVYASL